jgi:hypothetical protein
MTSAKGFEIGVNAVEPKYENKRTEKVSPQLNDPKCRLTVVVAVKYSKRYIFACDQSCREVGLQIIADQQRHSQEKIRREQDNYGKPQRAGGPEPASGRCALVQVVVFLRRVMTLGAQLPGRYAYIACHFQRPWRRRRVRGHIGLRPANKYPRTTRTTNFPALVLRRNLKQALTMGTGYIVGHDDTPESFCKRDCPISFCKLLRSDTDARFRLLLDETIVRRST